jgi:PAS domain S-box-containing protein
MTPFSTSITVFALAAPTTAVLASLPTLTALGRSLASQGTSGWLVAAGGALLIGVGATAWAGVTTLWTSRARKRQYQHRARLHDLVRRFDEAIILTDMRGTITAMNGAAESMTGWREAAAIGLPIGAVYQRVEPQTHRPVVNPVVKALYKATAVGPSLDAILLTQDGEERRIQDIASPIRDGHDRPFGCAIVCRELGEPTVGGRRVEIRESRR